ncbi:MULTISPECIES: TIGR03619 family F420-dependent LLM class oxidoreductase [unclassified Streptomyces]|uniref:TIGR03619 family F420-dependent LLM class oxidoreductase n=1 Tax=unclassified Streptomyces TaxID=2593676 RepID=UPI0036FFFBCA
MELGVYGLSAKATLGPADTARLARRAEEWGYRSWWVGDHVVLPSPRVPASPMAPTDPILDPLVHLSYVAALTERMELGTGILILPQRNPVVLAKQVASLDVLSEGRLLLGVAPGYLEPEMAAVDVRLSERGGRTDEYLDAMRQLWNEPQPAFHGRYANFERVDAYPRPVRPDGPRIMIGGHSPAAYRRAVLKGHGWIGNGSSPEDLETPSKVCAKPRRRCPGRRSWAVWRSTSCRSTRSRWTRTARGATRNSGWTGCWSTRCRWRTRPR